MIVPTTHRPRIHCSVAVLYARGALPEAAKLGAMREIARTRPDLARKVLQGQELTMISGRGDEFTVSLPGGD
jgi:hypothetical protein